MSTSMQLNDLHSAMLKISKWYWIYNGARAHGMFIWVYQFMNKNYFTFASHQPRLCRSLNAFDQINDPARQYTSEYLCDVAMMHHTSYITVSYITVITTLQVMNDGIDIHCLLILLSFQWVMCMIYIFVHVSELLLILGEYCHINLLIIFNFIDLINQ